eukprot:6973965-Pyramimonas_sp.AAC.1
MEGMMAMMSTFKQATDNGRSEDVAWKAAVSTATMTKPFWAGWSMSLQRVCKVTTDDHMKEARDMVASLLKVPATAAPNHGYCGGSFLDKIASMCWKKELCDFSRVRIACMVGQMLSPVHKIIDGRASLIKDAQLTKLLNPKNIEEVRFAEKMLDDARELCNTYNVDQGRRAKLLCGHDTRI